MVRKGRGALSQVSVFADVVHFLQCLLGEIEVVVGLQLNQAPLGGTFQQPVHADHVALVLARSESLLISALCDDEVHPRDVVLGHLRSGAACLSSVQNV